MKEIKERMKAYIRHEREGKFNRRPEFINIIFTDIDFTGFDISRCDFNGCIFTRVVFDEDKQYGSSFIGCKFKECTPESLNIVDKFSARKPRNKLYRSLEMLLNEHDQLLAETRRLHNDDDVHYSCEVSIPKRRSGEDDHVSFWSSPSRAQSCLSMAPSLTSGSTESFTEESIFEMAARLEKS